MTRTLISLLTAALLASASQAGETAHGPNGGPVIDAGPYHAELVVEGPKLTIHVTTHEADAPVDTAGATGFAVVQAGGKAERLTLAPDAPNRLVASGASAIAADAKIAVTFTIAGQKPASGRFDRGQEHDGHAH